MTRICIIINDNIENILIFTGGLLVSLNIVLSAAHCDSIPVGIRVGNILTLGTLLSCCWNRGDKVNDNNNDDVGNAPTKNCLVGEALVPHCDILCVVLLTGQNKQFFCCLFVERTDMVEELLTLPVVILISLLAQP